MRRAGPALLVLLLGACAETPPPSADREAALQAVAARAPVIATLSRAALACGQTLSMPAQDRAAAIEAAAIAWQAQHGGAAARDAWLQAVAAPDFDPRHQGRDRAAWCARHRTDMQRISRWLDSAEGEAFASRASEAAQP